MKVKYWERSPVTARDTFLLSPDEYTIHAEGVIVEGTNRRLQLEPVRRTRGNNRGGLMRLQRLDEIEKAVADALTKYNVNLPN